MRIRFFSPHLHDFSSLFVCSGSGSFVQFEGRLGSSTNLDHFSYLSSHVLQILAVYLFAF